MSDDNISFSAGEINLITSLLTQAYQSWTDMIEDDDYPDEYSKEDCEAILEVITETLEKFLVISDEILDNEEIEDSEDFPNNVIKFPSKK